MKSFILLITAALLFWINPFLCAEKAENAEDPKPATPEDEIIHLRQEISELRELLLQLVQILPPEQKEKLHDVINRLETRLQKKQKERYSNTTREVNKLKQKIEEVKTTLKELTGGVAFSGFFDVTASGYKNNPNIFALGDFELDMEKAFGNNFQVAAALVFNDQGAAMATGFIDFHLFGGPVSARGRLFTEKGLHFQVGRFDVPFGNDWQYFAATDRITVTSPLTSELVMEGGYNDVGLRILRAAIPYNLTLYMLRGIEEGIAVGGRFGFTPFNNPYTLKKKQIQLLELGVSYMHDFDRGGNREEKALALDFETAFGPLHLQGEYIRRDYDIAATRFHGYHISSFLDLGKFSKIPLTLYSRWDYFQAKPLEPAEKDRLSRLTLGVNVNLFDISVVKAEFLHYIKENELFQGSSFFAQLVITF